MNLVEVMALGGWVMWPILLCLLLTLAVFVNRWFALRRGRVDTSQFLLKLKSLYRHGDIPAVMSYCSQKDVPIASIVRRGILKRNLGTVRIREIVEGAAREEMFRMERHLGLLAAMSSLAPTLGFLGSILGLMSVFQTGQSAGAAQAGLPGGIWQALLCTVFGLIVGMVAMIGYNGFVAKIRKLVHELESACNEFLDMLDEPASDDGGSNGDELKIALRSHAVEPDPFQRKS